MEHDLVFNVDQHDYCGESGYCKRCGIHIVHAEELNYMCSFATNSVAITHIRATTIADEKRAEANRKTMEYIEKVRAKLDKREMEIIEALEGVVDSSELDYER